LKINMRSSVDIVSKIYIHMSMDELRREIRRMVRVKRNCMFSGWILLLLVLSCDCIKLRKLRDKTSNR